MHIGHAEAQRCSAQLAPAPATSVAIPQSLQPVGLHHVTPGLTGHHVVTVMSFNKDQVSCIVYEQNFM